MTQLPPAKTQAEPENTGWPVPDSFQWPIITTLRSYSQSVRRDRCRTDRDGSTKGGSKRGDSRQRDANFGRETGNAGSHTADPEQIVPRGVCPFCPVVFLLVRHLTLG